MTAISTYTISLLNGSDATKTTKTYTIKEFLALFEYELINDVEHFIPQPSQLILNVAEVPQVKVIPDPNFKNLLNYDRTLLLPDTQGRTATTTLINIAHMMRRGDARIDLNGNIDYRDINAEVDEWDVPDEYHMWAKQITAISAIRDGWYTNIIPEEDELDLITLIQMGLNRLFDDGYDPTIGIVERYLQISYPPELDDGTILSPSNLRMGFWNSPIPSLLLAHPDMTRDDVFDLIRLIYIYMCVMGGSYRQGTDINDVQTITRYYHSIDWNMFDNQNGKVRVDNYFNQNNNYTTSMLLRFLPTAFDDDENESEEEQELFLHIPEIRVRDKIRVDDNDDWIEIRNGNLEFDNLPEGATILHFIHNQIRNANGNYSGYAGFAKKVMEVTPMYKELMATGKLENKSLITHQIVKNHLLVLNYVSTAQTFKQDLLRYAESLTPYNRRNIYTIKIGTGLWKHKWTEVFEILKAYWAPILRGIKSKLVVYDGVV